MRPELQPCACYTKMRQLGLPSDMFFGCRMAPDGEVNCARCFRVCPKCAGHNSSDSEVASVSFSTDGTVAFKTEPQTPTNKDHLTTTTISDRFPPPQHKLPQKPRYWRRYEVAGVMFHEQNMLLTAQRFAFDHTTSSAMDEKIRRDVHHLATQVEFFEKLGLVSKHRMEVLKKRQSVLIMRMQMLPAWKEMSEFMSKGGTFWSTSLGHMRARIDESQYLLDELAKTNILKYDLPNIGSNQRHRPNTSQAYGYKPPNPDFPLPVTTTGIDVPKTVIGIAI